MMLPRYVYGMCVYLVLCHGTPVQDGKIVYPRMLEARDGRGAGRVLKIADNLVLNLERSNPYSENFVVRSDVGDDVAEEYYFRAADYDSYFFHDPEQKAAVAVTERDGLQVEGVLGEKLRIRPLPESERSDEGHVAHLLFEIDPQSPQKSDTIIPEKQVFESLAREAVEERQELPYRIYPELYLVLDSAFVKKFKKGLESIVFYFGVMINSVNMRYVSVTEPKVRIRIVGLELKNERNQSYVKYGSHAGHMKGVATLGAFREYYMAKAEYNKYDMIFLVTGLNIVETAANGDILDMGGFAFVGGICTDIRFGVAEDIPKTWHSIRNLAHEVGHLLGCPHDGDPVDASLNHPTGATQCPWDWGYIMSYNQDSIKEFSFSPCCNDMIRHLARMPSRKCMLTVDVPISYNNRTDLPGQYFDRHQQCKASLGYVLGETYSLNTQSAKEALTRCKLQCLAARHVFGYRTHLETFAMDGTKCGEGKVCANGLCRKIPNIKPDRVRKTHGNASTKRKTKSSKKQRKRT